ncbi:3-mercaptopyruvate sulfurtransferase [Parvularcula sp. LCG005]|uniref:3-mercaptopyruvate sulfurtransferase n=1 Tax=Parvularcula sp. LCG005 TaxID=3078805 RepID=UPI00294354A6|nr:3-mercaptopyruvate sulfurtransferase [Parvularcula sp. LCG005]WOI53911.1 3-mercaptopyruvate sulfurtransferase [Parvularcula sp. LCG005]
MTASALVSADALLSGGDLPKFVDGSWYLGGDRNPAQEYLEAHLPGAVRFDLDEVADHKTDLPHMLPAPAAFASAVGRFGLSHTDDIVIYEAGNLLASPRVWWTFRAMGVQSVRILDGGMRAWREAGGAIHQGHYTPEAVRFDARFDPSVVVGCGDIQEIVSTQSAQIIDARPAARFRGEAPEPRPGLRCGAMPGAINIPSSSLLTDGRMKSEEALKAIFADAGVDAQRPIVTTCGSGVTAALLLLGLEVAGYLNIRLYDGSWAEWGRTDADNCPVQTI